MNRAQWLALAGSLAATAIAYHAVGRGAFVYDDLALVQANPSIRSFSNAGDWFSQSFWRGVYNPADADHIPYYRPVVTGVFALGYALGGGEPAAFHWIDLGLHLATVAFAFSLAIRFFGESPRATLGAAVAAAAFGLHPAHTENVAWISGVSDVAASALGLAAAICCLRAGDLLDAARAAPPDAPAGAPPAARLRLAVWLSLGFVLALLAFLAKESVLVLPFAVLIADALVAERFVAKRLWTWAAPAAAVAAYFGARIAVFGPRAGLDLTQTALGLPAWRVASLRFELFASYLRTLAWPFDLNAFRPLRVDLDSGSPEIACGRWVTIGALATMALLAIGSARWRAARAPLAFALATGLTILPQIVRPQSLGHFVFADRYVYVPSLGFCWLLGWLAMKIGERSIWLGIAAAAPVVASFGWKTLERVPVWRDEPTLFSNAEKESPDCATVLVALGRIHLDRYQRNGDAADLDVAFAKFAAAIDKKLRERVFVSNQDVLQAYLGLASVHMLRKRVEEAYSVYEQAIALYPNCEEAHMLAGVALAQLGNHARAEAALKKAIELRPTFAAAHYNLGNFHLNQSQLSLAIEELRAALKIDPGLVEARLALATALQRLGNAEEAKQVLRSILEDFPNHPSVPTIREFLK